MGDIKCCKYSPLLDFKPTPIFTIGVSPRTATVIDEYPHPLAHPHNGIVVWAVCGFRNVRSVHLGLDTALPPQDDRYTAFVIDVPVW